MNYKEKLMDLFELDSKFLLAQCISSDLAMGMGIALEFNKHFDMKSKMIEYSKHNDVNVGDCVVIDNVANLITKQYYYNKPTYDTLAKALMNFKKYVVKNNIKHIAMPCIGCGLDKLQWSQVSNMIKYLFRDLDIDIVICFV